MTFLHHVGRRHKPRIDDPLANGLETFLVQVRPTPRTEEYIHASIHIYRHTYTVYTPIRVCAHLYMNTQT